jgi:hypothetical protein
VKYSSTLSLTFALDGDGWLKPRPGRFAPDKDTGFHCMGLNIDACKMSLSVDHSENFPIGKVWNVEESKIHLKQDLSKEAEHGYRDLYSD